MSTTSRSRCLLPAVLLALAACGAGEAPERRSLLVVTFDTLRRDAVGFMGASPSPSPVLDGLAQESVVFEDAYTVAPLTLPAHASLMTGLYPVSHGVRDNSLARVPAAAETLAEALQARGYATGASVAAFVLDPAFGLDQGFDTYHAPPRPIGGVHTSVVHLRGDEVTDRALADLRALARGDAPFFYWLHLYDPHHPYDAPGAPPGSGATPAGYRAEVRFADRQLGRVIDELKDLGAWDELVVLFTSDHGEGLDDGLEISHGTFVDDTQVRIPLLVRHPELPPRRIGGQVSLIDVAPTLLELLGARVPDRIDGLSLAPVLRGEVAAPPERALAVESYAAWFSFGWAPFEGLVEGPWKYVRSRRTQLFRRDRDPREEDDVFDPEDERSTAMAARSEAHFRDPRHRLEREAAELSAGDIEALASLGYAGAGLGASLAGDPDFDALPDTYARRALLDRLFHVFSRLEGDEPEQVLPEMRALLDLDPENPVFLLQLGSLLLYAGTEHVDEAEPLLRRLVELRPSDIQAHWFLSYCHVIRSELVRKRMQELSAAGRREEAADLVPRWRGLVQETRAELRAVLALQPNHPGALSNLAISLHGDAEAAARQGRTDEAAGIYREVLELLDTLLADLGPEQPEYEYLSGIRAGVREKLAPAGSR